METHRENLEFLGLDEGTFFGVEAGELPKADVRLKEGDRVFDMDLVVLETPGHTPGSVCFYSEREGILFSGDTLFFDGVGRSDLPGGSEKKLRESIQKKIAPLPPETRVFPGHGPFTTVEREKRGNPYLRDAAPESRAAGMAGTIVLPHAGSAPRPVAAPGAAPAAAASPARPTPGRRQASVAGPSSPARRKAAGRAAGGKASPSGAVRARRVASKVVPRPPRAAKAAGKHNGSAPRRPLKRPDPRRSAPARKKTPQKPARRKAAQATRSTKAPGAGKRPSR